LIQFDGLDAGENGEMMMRQLLKEKIQVRKRRNAQSGVIRLLTRLSKVKCVNLVRPARDEQSEDVGVRSGPPLELPENRAD
jgi:hypothetical protein